MAENIDFLEVDNVIYEAGETTTRPTAQQNHPQKIPPDRRQYKWVGVGLLCAVLALLSIAVPLHLCQSYTVEREQLVSSYNQLLDNLTRERDQSLRRNYNLTRERDQLLDRINNLNAERDQSLDRNNKLTSERDDLKMRLCESPGWQKFDRGCYYISTQKNTWEESRKWCKDRQSDLIVINSQREQDFVASFNKRVWLGLTDHVTEGLFQWVDGTPLTTPTYWYPLEPHREDNNPNAIEDCVEYYVDSTSGWNDAPCSSSVNWMCERVVC